MQIHVARHKPQNSDSNFFVSIVNAYRFQYIIDYLNEFRLVLYTCVTLKGVSGATTSTKNRTMNWAGGVRCAVTVGTGTYVFRTRIIFKVMTGVAVEAKEHSVYWTSCSDSSCTILALAFLEVTYSIN